MMNIENIGHRFTEIVNTPEWKKLQEKYPGLSKEKIEFKELKSLISFKYFFAFLFQ